MKKKKKLKKFFKKKLKKIFAPTFWLVVNSAAIAVIILFFYEEFFLVLSRNIWINVSILIIGIVLIKEAPIFIRRSFEKTGEKGQKNKFFKRMFLLLINLNLNIIAVVLILSAINGSFLLTIDIFFAKTAIGIIFIINIYKTKKLLEKMRRYRPADFLIERPER